MQNPSVRYLQISFLPIDKAPSLARPANADKPSVLPIVGVKALPIDKIVVNRLPPTCFRILVLANLISMPLFKRRFLFLYINDINDASNLLNLILFADDTNVLMSHKDLNHLSDMLTLEMDKLPIWFKANKLSLNLKKTKFMVFKPRQKRSICNIQISIDKQNIVEVKEDKFSRRNFG